MTSPEATCDINELSESSSRWFVASVPIWALVGVLNYAVPFLILELGLAPWALELPRSMLFGSAVAAVQCGVLPTVRSWAGRWILSATAGGAIASALIWFAPWLAMPRPISLLLPLLLGAFVAIPQRWSMQGRVRVPGWFVWASLLACAAGTCGALLLALLFLAGMR